MQIQLQRTAECLEMPVTLDIILPEQMGKEPLKSLYLLHDYGGNRMEWLLKTSLIRYVERMNVAVILPDGNNRYFINPEDGHKYADYITKELPEYLSQILPLSKKSCDQIIAGGGMGGYGAIRAFLDNPGQYGEAVVWNPHLNLDRLYEERISPDARYTFGEMGVWRNTEMDPFYLAVKADGKKAGILKIQWESGWKDAKEALELAQVCQNRGWNIFSSEEREWNTKYQEQWTFFDAMLQQWMKKKRTEWGGKN